MEYRSLTSKPITAARPGWNAARPGGSDKPVKETPAPTAEAGPPAERRSKDEEIQMSRLAIGGDPGMGDEYLCEILDSSPHGHDPPPSPIVKIIGLLKYPAQRAIMPPHPAHEAPPLAIGLICRLPILRSYLGEPLPSPEEALRRAILETRTEEERAILLRHLSGDVGGKRSIVTLSSHDLDYLRLCCAAEDRHDADH